MLNFINKKTIINSVVSIIILFLIFLLVEFLNVGYIDLKHIKIFLFCSVVINIVSFLFVSQKQYYKNFILIFLFFISFLFIGIFKNSIFDYNSIKNLIAFYVGISTLTLISVCFFNKKFKLLSYILQLIFLFPTLFILQYFFISGGLVNIDTILAVFQTNFGEAKSYIYDFIGIKQIVGFIIILIFSIFILKNNNKLKLNNINNKKFLVILILSILLNLFLIYKYKNNFVVKTAFDTTKYLKVYRDFKKQVSERNVNDIKIEEKENINKGIYVLVIGESQNKEHMSAYGYNKKTTPWLEAMENEENFIKFENIYACNTHTVPVLSYALTSKNQYNEIDISEAVSILDVAKAADIQTVWLSNQIHYGGWDTPVSVIADSAQQQKWINKNFGEHSRTTFYDIELIQALKSIKLYDNMLIIIHLMGNHGYYEDRYPEEFNIFKNENSRIAKYDNSILYNDYVVKNIFETVKGIPNFKALIYFADHADAVDQNLGHDVTQYVPNMTYIPFYVFLSDSYIRNNKQLYINLCNNRNCFWTNDLLFDLLLRILNIKIPEIYEQENDITSENYNNNISRFRTLNNKPITTDFNIENIVKYYNIPKSEYENKRNITVPKKSIWLHRVNKKERIKKYFDLYTGFETDIHFNSKKQYFNVSHDNIDGDENLADMLKNIKGLEQKYLWLDFKNLEQSNKEEALINLNKIVKDNKLLREHIIVESQNPAALDIFEKAGYYTSFYLNCYSSDWKQSNKFPGLLSEYIKELNDSIVDFVSCDAHYFDIVKYYFPKVAHLFWVTDGPKNQKNKTDHIFETDKNTYVILNQN